MSKHDDLEILRASGTDRESSEGYQEPVQDAKHEAPGWRHRAWPTPTREFPAPTRSLGADHVIDYTTDDFVPGGPRFDVMLDNVGNRTSKEVLSVVGLDGRYVAISGPKENRLLGPISHIMRVTLAFMRAEPSFHQFTASPIHDDLTCLGELLSLGRLVPQVQQVVGLDCVAEGLAEIGIGHARAKIVVVSD